jgi:hypothetical protein
VVFLEVGSHQERFDRLPKCIRSHQPRALAEPRLDGSSDGSYGNFERSIWAQRTEW